MADAAARERRTRLLAGPGRGPGAGRAADAGETALIVLSALLVLVVAVAAGFGWLDLLRSLGALDLGPDVADGLPLRRLAGHSAQPLLRVLVAFGSVGLAAGFALGRLPRLGRVCLLLVGSLALLALGSQIAYGVQETQSLGTTLSARHPGIGVLFEAAFLAAAGALPAGTSHRPG